jgi:hypothetical protein
LLTAPAAAFGDAERITELLAPDAQRWITPSVGVLGGPTVGRDAIRAAMRVIFGVVCRWQPRRCRCTGQFSS